MAWPIDNNPQDVATKIMSFAQHGSRAVCVMSANGAISNVTLRQQSSSGGTVTYEVLYIGWGESYLGKSVTTTASPWSKACC